METAARLARLTMHTINRPVALVIAALLLAACERGSRRAGGGADTVSDTSARPAPQPTSSSVLPDSLRALVEAAAAGDTLRVQALLARGVSPNPPSLSAEVSATPLFRAAEYGRTDVVRLLLAAGADVNHGDYVSASPLHYAARAGHVEVVRLLLSSGADVSGGIGGGFTPLHEAARSRASGSLEVVRLLLAHGASPEVRTFDDGRTPLDYATRTGRADIARLLVAARAAEPVPVPVLAAEEPQDVVWLARDVLPLALEGESFWVVAVVTEHSGLDGGESACAYRVPWRPAAMGHGLWVQTWAIAYGRILVFGSPDELAAQVEGSPERCTPQADVDRRWADVQSGLEGEETSVVSLPNAVWRLAETETFGHDGQVFRATQQVDSTATSRQTRVCFSSGGWPRERCVTVRTTRGATYDDRVEATVAVVLDRALWVFGLRTFGQRRGEPVWSAAAIAIKPVLLGRVLVDSQ